MVLQPEPQRAVWHDGTSGPASACAWALLLSYLMPFSCPLLCILSAVTVLNEDVKPRQYLMCGQTAQVKLKNVVPHDIGDPGEGFDWDCWRAEGVQGCRHSFLRVVDFRWWESGVVDGLLRLCSGNEKLGWFGVSMKGGGGKLGSSGKLLSLEMAQVALWLCWCLITAPLGPCS